jgi:spore coat protein U-like protein
MKSRLSRLLAGVALLALSLSAQSAITCSVYLHSGVGMTIAYTPPAAGFGQSSIDVQCNRTTGDPTTMSYDIKADNGSNPQGNNNRARSGTSLINYDVYLDSSCTTKWKGNASISGTINFSGGTSATNTHSYWGCVPANQTGLAGGTYTDTVTMTMKYPPNGGTTATGTFPVAITVPFSCNISLAPGTVAFGTYTAFGPPLTASTSFGITCSNTLPYSVAVSPSYGVINGLNYSVAPSVSSTAGTGIQQLFSINGAMPGGQAGTCATGSCPLATLSHVLTLTY